MSISMTLEEGRWAKFLWNQTITLWSHFILSEGYLEHFDL